MCQNDLTSWGPIFGSNRSVWVQSRGQIDMFGSHLWSKYISVLSIDEINLLGSHQSLKYISLCSIYRPNRSVRVVSIDEINLLGSDQCVKWICWVLRMGQKDLL